MWDSSATNSTDFLPMFSSFSSSQTLIRMSFFRKHYNFYPLQKRPTLRLTLNGDQFSLSARYMRKTGFRLAHGLEHSTPLNS